SHFIAVQEDAVVVDKYVITNADMLSVVAKEGIFYPHFLPNITQQGFQNRPLLLTVLRANLTISGQQLTYAVIAIQKFGVPRVISQPGKHAFFLCHKIVSTINSSSGFPSPNAPAYVHPGYPDSFHQINCPLLCLPIHSYRHDNWPWHSIPYRRMTYRH